MTTRQAIDELRKRGHSGINIINLAYVAQGYELVFFDKQMTLAQALINYVQETPNTRHCLNCKADTHHIQNYNQTGDVLR